MESLTTELPQMTTLDRISRILSEQVKQKIYNMIMKIGILKVKNIELKDLLPPDSMYSQKATELVKTVNSKETYLHCLRSYKFSVAIGRYLNQKFDKEVLYLSTILHDIGLTKDFCGPQDFELEGAIHANKFLLKNGYDKLKADIVHEAIALHTSVLGKEYEKHPEIQLANSGIGLDVLGLNQHCISPSTLKSIIQEHNRSNFPDVLIRETIEDSFNKPNCHIKAYLDLGLAKAMHKNPLCNIH